MLKKQKKVLYEMSRNSVKKKDGKIKCCQPIDQQHQEQYSPWMARQNNLFLLNNKDLLI